MSTPVLVLGYLASICIPLAFLPQTLRIIIKKETKGISITSYTIYLLGCLAFFVFGIYHKDIPMIICQSIAGILGIIILALAITNVVKDKKGTTKEVVNNQENKDKISGKEEKKDKIDEQPKESKDPKDPKEGDQK